MRLADRISQCRTLLTVRNPTDGTVAHLTGAAAFCTVIDLCATRYVLSDELTRLCTALAYSKGASTLFCTDLLHVPAQSVWIEWTEAPWRNELARYGFKTSFELPCSGRRGALVQADPSGRGGILRTFWTSSESEERVFCSSMEAYFDFDTQEDEDPVSAAREKRPSIAVSDAAGRPDLLRRCFRFRFERTWQDYYDRARLTPQQVVAITQHAVGTIAIDVPVILAFFLLLVTRPSLPRRPLTLERVNRARSRSGKTRLLDQIEVFAPVLSQFRNCDNAHRGTIQPPRRLHHVRGHLVRRGNTLFWRVPHLRGSARAGSIRTRTVTWLLDSSTS